MGNKSNHEKRPDNPAGEGAQVANAAVRRVLVESYRDLCGFLRRRLGNESEAEEVLQDFMLRALERADDLRDVRSVRGWLSRLLASAIVNHQRRAITRRRREVTMSMDDIEVFAVERDTEIDKAVCDCLYRLLPTLRPEHAEMIWRIDLLGEPRDRVAVSLGTSVNTHHGTAAPWASGPQEESRRDVYRLREARLLSTAAAMRWRRVPAPESGKAPPQGATKNHSAMNNNARAKRTVLARRVCAD